MRQTESRHALDDSETQNSKTTQNPTTAPAVFMGMAATWVFQIPCSQTSLRTRAVSGSIRPIEPVGIEKSPRLSVGRKEVDRISNPARNSDSLSLTHILCDVCAGQPSVVRRIVFPCRATRVQTREGRNWQRQEGGFPIFREVNDSATAPSNTSKTQPFRPTIH